MRRSSTGSSRRRWQRSSVRLAAANLHRRNREAESVLRFVHREAPDVLLLTELTPELSYFIRHKLG